MYLEKRKESIPSLILIGANTRNNMPVGTIKKGIPNLAWMTFECAGFENALSSQVNGS
jgi:hypothetical protein